MPNWCENTLTVHGEPELLAVFLDTVKSVDRDVELPLDFRRIRPTPIGPGGSSIDWCVNNWGTKWQTTDCELDDKRQFGFCEFRFSTAWSPPVPIVDCLAQSFPDLTFELSYWEAMLGGFAGAIGYEHGSKQCQLHYTADLQEPADCERSIYFCALQAMKALSVYRYPRRWVRGEALGSAGGGDAPRHDAEDIAVSEETQPSNQPNSQTLQGTRG
jgi:hypothetical protein